MFNWIITVPCMYYTVSCLLYLAKDNSTNSTCCRPRILLFCLEIWLFFFFSFKFNKGCWVKNPSRDNFTEDNLQVALASLLCIQSRLFAPTHFKIPLIQHPTCAQTHTSVQIRVWTRIWREQTELLSGALAFLLP